MKYEKLNEESKKSVQFVKHTLNINNEISIDNFIDITNQWIKENNIDISKFEPIVCPINLFASVKNKSCYNTNQGIAYCPVCNKSYCPVCMQHEVAQLSRVTGYIQEVSGWNIAKQQELKDRKRYEIR